ncbi:response regulator/GGDEF domain protein [Cystobacter fuscus DSM 2262]|uniref:Response regulator/GGDEF domain protein n=1 Tax=Cystobacter fuscus (strain ATCC 25194 / DSM 2262 / NBRC 100088 / M29) TaxID=1242864 RepID=S9PE89_CYSF2|nr:diguanylate cyclase [Cystobacter fuscus]EPX62680.1 response regulator/GGDEF domain protein [Cystobacter fuscus DSM 2262]
MALVLVAEPSVAVAGALRRFLEGAGHEVLVASALQEALERVRELAPVLVLSSVTESFDGEGLCRQVKEELPGTPVLLLYLPEEESPETRSASAGAEACLVGPLKRATVVSCVSLMIQLAKAREAVSVVRTEMQLLQHQGNRREATAPLSDLEFFKRLLFMEVKRSRRYRYPIAYLLLEPDRYAEKLASLPPPVRTSALAEMLRRISDGLRDIDVAVPFAEGRFIIFLPYTPYEGALVVAERLLQRVKQVESVQGLTASLGLAVFEPSAAKGQAQVSFGSLMKEAGEALRRAQASGGDRVEGRPVASEPAAPAASEPTETVVLDAAPETPPE